MSGHPDGSEVLRDLPPSLWLPLLRAVRRAVEQQPRSALPALLRPFATWKPERLLAPRALAAVADALATEARLREDVAAALGGAVVDAARSEDPLRLAARVGDDVAAAALAAIARWDALAVLAAAAAQRHAAEQRAGAEADAARHLEQEARLVGRLQADVAALREERDAQRRRADAAEQRWRSERTERERLEAEVRSLRGALAAAAEQHTEEARRLRDRLARARRRQEEAEGRARVDERKALSVADELAALATSLRNAVKPPDDAPPATPPTTPPADAPTAAPASASSLPRDTPPPAPGRPCRLPPGLTDDDVTAVDALLRVAGLEVLVDGYNLAMRAHGRQWRTATLDDQRRWVVRLAAGVAGRYGRRVIVVFDGNERATARVAPRGVQVVFTEGGEIADERIVALVEALPPTAPVLVVTSDREVRRNCALRGANVTSAEAFLDVVGG